jgi:hypothetical protein
MVKKKRKFKPKELNLLAMEINMRKQCGWIKDTTIRSQADKRRFYKPCYFYK